MITGLRYDAFRSIPKKRRDENSLRNIDIIYPVVFAYHSLWNLCVGVE